MQDQMDHIPDYQQPETSPDIAAQVQMHVEGLSLMGWTVLYNTSDFLKDQRVHKRGRLKWDGEAFGVWT